MTHTPTIEAHQLAKTYAGGVEAVTLTVVATRTFSRSVVH